MQTSSPSRPSRVRSGQTERLALNRRILYPRSSESANLILEVLPPFEREHGAVIREPRDDCKYWRAALAAHAHG
jgi:hypothetical protein